MLPAIPYQSLRDCLGIAADASIARPRTLRALHIDDDPHQALSFFL
ncbi:hypothetical protein BSLA_01f4947 [Burkholderia stabilis]|nr:hypothetical protein BSLA_01f4947 [Burkholderia stabilis]